MQDLMILLAKTIPVDSIIENIEERINKYKEDKSKENLEKVTFSCNLLLINQIDRNAHEIISDLDTHMEIFESIDAAKDIVNKKD